MHSDVALSPSETAGLESLRSSGTIDAARAALDPCCGSISQLRGALEDLEGGAVSRAEADAFARAYATAAGHGLEESPVHDVADWACRIAPLPPGAFDAPAFLDEVSASIEAGGGSCRAIQRWIEAAPAADVAGEKTRTSYVRERLAGLFWVRLSHLCDSVGLEYHDVLDAMLAASDEEGDDPVAVS